MRWHPPMEDKPKACRAAAAGPWPRSQQPPQSIRDESPQDPGKLRSARQLQRPQRCKPRKQGQGIAHVLQVQSHRAARAEATPAGRLSAFIKRIFTWQNLNRQFPPPFGWLESYVLRHADGAIAGNQEAAVVLKRKGYRGPLTVIPQFGVDPDLYRPLPRPLPGAERGDCPPSRAREGAGGWVSPPGLPGAAGGREGLFAVLLQAVSSLEGAWELDWWARALCDSKPRSWSPTWAWVTEYA